MTELIQYSYLTGMDQNGESMSFILVIAHMRSYLYSPTHSYKEQGLHKKRHYAYFSLWMLLN